VTLAPLLTGSRAVADLAPGETSTETVTLTVPSFIATEGTRTITVFTPPPGGGTSNGTTLTVVARVTRIISLSGNLAFGNVQVGMRAPGRFRSPTAAMRL